MKHLQPMSVVRASNIQPFTDFYFRFLSIVEDFKQVQKTTIIDPSILGGFFGGGDGGGGGGGGGGGDDDGGFF